MSANTINRLSFVFAVGLMAVAARPAARGQDPPDPPPVFAAKTVAEPYVFGSKDCNACHARVEPRDGTSRMIEGFIWKNRDPHKIAMDWGKGDDPNRFGGFRSVAGQRAAEIGERLEITNVTRAPQCIGCHSLSVPASTPKQDFSNPVSEGVTCVACHGPYHGWATEHQAIEQPRWKKLTRSQKWIEYGMVDLWDPVVRARTCMSCHIGDPDPQAGKMITHAMYAAGHPPLPSIEVAAFSEEEPRHWLLLRCKDKVIQDRLEFQPGRLEQTEQVVVGGLAALGREMELFEVLAAAPKAKDTWPEFARFDCYPCHHELRSSGGEVWRRDRTYAVGRPSAVLWPMVLARLGLEAADPAKAVSRKAQLDELVRRFHAALTERPFGNPETIPPAARAVTEWLKAPLSELSRMAAVKKGERRRILDRTEALRLLGILTRTAGSDIQDFESARQIGWAFRTINHELAEVNSELPGNDPAFMHLAQNQPRIREILKGLEDDLVLSLRERGTVAIGACPPADQVMRYPTTPDQKPIIGGLLETRLRKLADYNPAVFQRRFMDLSKLIP
jgi:hypothetical protein